MTIMPLALRTHTFYLARKTFSLFIFTRNDEHRMSLYSLFSKACSYSGTATSTNTQSTITLGLKKVVFANFFVIVPPLLPEIANNLCCRFIIKHVHQKAFRRVVVLLSYLASFSSSYPFYDEEPLEFFSYCYLKVFALAMTASSILSIDAVWRKNFLMITRYCYTVNSSMKSFSSIITSLLQSLQMSLLWLNFRKVISVLSYFFSNNGIWFSRYFAYIVHGIR